MDSLFNVFKTFVSTADKSYDQLSDVSNDEQNTNMESMLQILIYASIVGIIAMLLYAFVTQEAFDSVLFTGALGFFGVVINTVSNIRSKRTKRKADAEKEAAAKREQQSRDEIMKLILQQQIILHEDMRYLTELVELIIQQQSSDDGK